MYAACAIGVRWQLTACCFEKPRQECRHGPIDKQWQMHSPCERKVMERKRNSFPSKRKSKEECTNGNLLLCLWNFVKCVITVQPTDNITCVRTVESYGGSQKLLFPSGRESKREVQLFPRTSLIFRDLCGEWMSMPQPVRETETS